MDNLRDVVAEVNLSTKVTYGLNRGRPQLVGCIRPLETLDDDWKDQVHVLLDARSEHVERLDHSQQVLLSTVGELGGGNVPFKGS